MGSMVSQRHDASTRIAATGSAVWDDRPVTPPDLRVARRAAAVAFGTQGLLFISLTTRLPDFTDRWGIGELLLSGLLLMIVLLAGAGAVVAEAVAKRRDSATMLRIGLVLLAIGVLGAALAPVEGMFVGALAVYGVGLGVVDATTNMQAVALEHGYGRPILPSFHGAWTLGGVRGAGLTLASASLPLEVMAVLAVVPVAAAFAPLLPRVSAAPDLSQAEAVPWRPILLVGLGMVLFYMVDTATQTWGPLYLDDTLDSPSELVALATFPYLLASGAIRLAGDGLVTRYGVVPVLRVGTVIGSAALALVVFAPSW